MNVNRANFINDNQKYAGSYQVQSRDTFNTSKHQQMKCKNTQNVHCYFPFIFLLRRHSLLNCVSLCDFIDEFVIWSKTWEATKNRSFWCSNFIIPCGNKHSIKWVIEWIKHYIIIYSVCLLYIPYHRNENYNQVFNVVFP